eukprot:COSAG06_NODE_34786_length_469_cov_0.986486_1_plen_41_part_10
MLKTGENLPRQAREGKQRKSWTKDVSAGDLKKEEQQAFETH